MRYADHYDHMGAGGWVFAAVMLVLLVAVAVAATIWLTRARQVGDARHASIVGRSGSARELLDHRLVAGEIGEDEYRRLRATLSETTSPGESTNPPPESL